MNWKNKKVLVAGGMGFIGKNLIPELKKRKALIEIIDLKNGYDLRELGNYNQIIKKSDIVFNLAANVGGIGYNANHQGRMFVDNIKISLNMLESFRQSGKGRYLCVSSACVYSNEVIIPTPETEGFKNFPEETNFGYGMAKRILELQAQIYHKESKSDIVIVRPYNTYGEYDHFGDKSHVIPSLIKRILNGENPLTIWGSGKQKRSFVYVKDTIEGMILAIEKGKIGEVYNLATQEEISIANLVILISELCHKHPKIRFLNKLTGQTRRLGDTTKAEQELGFKAKISLKKGLKKTIKWYKKYKNDKYNCN